jgi:hypothetical protein
MKTSLSDNSPRRRSGIAIVFVLVIISLMTALISSNSKSLYRFKREIDMVEEKQLRKFDPPAAVGAVNEEVKEEGQP